MSSAERAYAATRDADAAVGAVHPLPEPLDQPRDPRRRGGARGASRGTPGSTPRRPRRRRGCSRVRRGPRRCERARPPAGARGTRATSAAGVGTARTVLSTAAIFMALSSGLSQGLVRRVKAGSRRVPHVSASLSHPIGAARRSSGCRDERPPYNGFTMPGRTMFDKIWAQHVVATGPDGEALLYVDRNFVHEGSFHAFAQLRRRAGKSAAPTRRSPPPITTCRPRPAADGSVAPEIRGKVTSSRANAGARRIPHLGLDDPRQGIVHVIGPELGITQPGLTITCGDSHTSTHGALGALAFGIGASQLKQVLATQCIWQKKPERLRIVVDGPLGPGVGAKDVILALIAKIGTAGGTGHTIEYAGSAIRALSMEGAPDGLQHVDRSRRARRHGRAGRYDLRVPRGPAARAARRRLGARARVVAHARRATTARASTARCARRDARSSRRSRGARPPRKRCPSARACPRPGDLARARRSARSRAGARATWDSRRARPLTDSPIDRAFIGTCTNAASRTCAPPPRSSRAGKRVVPGDGSSPGSTQVKRAGRSRRPRPHLPRRGLRVARAPAARGAPR